MNTAFVDRSFSSVAYFLYNEFQVILFAVAVKIHDGTHLLLNPGDTYRLQSSDELHYMAQSEMDINRITKMVG
jgi:hypothetical protein